MLRVALITGHPAVNEWQKCATRKNRPDCELCYATWRQTERDAESRDPMFSAAVQRGLSALPEWTILVREAKCRRDILGAIE
jgi:hypothetical protein